MKDAANLVYVTLADFIVRAAYQMGKTPLLPLFAATLGASDVLLGTIVSVSTLTGMVTKPLFGILSDRQGRRWWLILGTLFFVVVPFLYRFIETPGQLVAVRIIHGTATAIYGPVTVAYVAERGGRRRAESLGWFGMARSGGYVAGPAVAGWLLLWMDPASVFSVIGLISCAAFVPVFLLKDGKETQRRQPPKGTRGGRPRKVHEAAGDRRKPASEFFDALKTGARTPAVWLSGGMEATVYVALYAAKAFLPIYALSAGYNTAQVGLFFSVQEGVHLVLKPFGGRLGDRFGYFRAIAAGMAVMAVALPLLTLASNFLGLLALAVVIGAAQALVFPATVALVSDQIEPTHLGAGMGLVGTLDNAGKVVGPVLGGLLIARLDYSGMFWLMGVLLLVGAVVIQMRSARGRSMARAAVIQER